jgi:hypothetical protein
MGTERGAAHGVPPLQSCNRSLLTAYRLLFLRLAFTLASSAAAAAVIVVAAVA